MKTSFVTLATALAIASVSAPALAHHSVPQYFDVSKTVTVTGTVEGFKFQNPHSIMTLIVRNDAGATEEWKGEGALAAWLIRNGWKPSMFPAGTKLTVSGNPARDPGAKMIRLVTVKMPDGRTLNANNGEAAN
jgi:hypothetical protein